MVESAAVCFEQWLGNVRFSYSVDNGFLHVHEIIKEKLMEVTYVEA
jgi:hypothetical protein